MEFNFLSIQIIESQLSSNLRIVLNLKIGKGLIFVPLSLH